MRQSRNRSVNRLWDLTFVLTFYPLLAVLSAVSTVLSWTNGE
jgi:hypothetical protein